MANKQPEEKSKFAKLKDDVKLVLGIKNIDKRIFYSKDQLLITARQDMDQYVKDTNFNDYPLLWKDESFDGREELIHYLANQEEMFKGIAKIDFANEEKAITDILSVDGVSNSQSSNFKDMHEFAFSLNRDAKKLNPDSNYIAFTTDNDYEDNCAFIKNEQHKLHNIKIQTWNNRKYIIIDNCSHHLAAIYRQCKEQERTYQLDLPIVYERINLEKLQQLLDTYYFIFSDIGNINLIDDKYQEIFDQEARQMHEYFRYGKPSHLLPLKKEHDFNKFLVKLLKGHPGNFLVLNDEIERLYLQNDN